MSGSLASGRAWADECPSAIVNRAIATAMVRIPRGSSRETVDELWRVMAYLLEVGSGLNVGVWFAAAQSIEKALEVCQRPVSYLLSG